MGLDCLVENKIYSGEIKHVTMECRICSEKTSPLFEHLVLGRHMVRYERCDDCGYVCTEDPYWLDEAYARPINLCDTGIVSRNEKLEFFQ